MLSKATLHYLGHTRYNVLWTYRQEGRKGKWEKEKRIKNKLQIIVYHFQSKRCKIQIISNITQIA